MIAAARVVVCKFSKPLSGLPPAIISSQVAPPLLHQIITSKVAFLSHCSSSAASSFSFQVSSSSARLTPVVSSQEWLLLTITAAASSPSSTNPALYLSIDCISQLLEEGETSFSKITFGFVFQFCCCSTNHGFLFPRLASNLFHFKLILEPTNARTKYHLKPFLFAFTDSHLVNCLDQPFSFQCCCNVTSTYIKDLCTLL